MRTQDHLGGLTAILENFCVGKFGSGREARTPYGEAGGACSEDMS